MSTDHSAVRQTPRRVVARANLSIDGYSSGPGGPQHDTWLTEHAVREQTQAHAEGIWRGVSTALLGRSNFEGFASVWPMITRETTDPRTRDLGTWLEAVDKVVFTRTSTAVVWGSSRQSDDLEGEVRRLTQGPGRDILVLNSASIISQLLVLDLIDDLQLTIVPVLLGGGLRLLPDGVSTDWELIETTTMAHGAIAVHYRRRRT